MQKITPFLWFDDNAVEAVAFYTSIFQDAEAEEASQDPDGPAGSPMVVPFTLFGQRFIALNGGPHYKFNEAVSFVVNCETQEEVDRYWSKLTEGGTEVQCGWLKDKFGLSWQVTPTILGELINDPDPEKGKRAMQAMMGMVKLDIAALKRAAEGA